MKKKIFNLLAIVMIVFLVTGCKKEDKELNNQYETNQLYDVELVKGNWALLNEDSEYVGGYEFNDNYTYRFFTNSDKTSYITGTYTLEEENENTLIYIIADEQYENDEYIPFNPEFEKIQHFIIKQDKSNENKLVLQNTFTNEVIELLSDGN